MKARLIGDVFEVDLMYPRCDGACKEIEVGLCDVRASDSIRISFDFDRNGWVVKQASTFEWSMEDTESDMDWQEVAFIDAWGRKKEGIADAE